MYFLQTNLRPVGCRFDFINFPFVLVTCGLYQRHVTNNQCGNASKTCRQEMIFSVNLSGCVPLFVCHKRVLTADSFKIN